MKQNTNMSSANNNEPPTPEPLNSAQTDMLLKPSSGLSHEQKKMYGHNRSPSREFKELTKRDAQILLNKELEKLQRTAQLPKAQADLVDKEFDGFRDLFGKFLTAEHQSVKWDKIEKLPADASLMPVARDIRTENDIEAWYPPGHGDFYQSFYNSHLLTELVSQGREFAFMSNIDNMGATVGDFLNRFASCPDIIELDHLTVSGNVNFGKNVALRGTVIIIANHGDQIDIPSGSILENKIVSGNLRILDH
eukprot:TCALIF_07840-PA protein Name:"Similar to UGP2 UTP--glucose-1-phosphate uridylyltransferase (Cricetulus griseus)" AED:0.28 eAED:0.28 QI:0/0.4/0.5/0.83/0.4/0.66/6/226/249